MDYYAITRYIDGELREQKAKYFEGRPSMEAQWQGAGDFVAMRNRLEAQRPEYPKGAEKGEKVSVDPKLLLADDVFAEPEWDENAERAWREWAVAELQKHPAVFDMYPEHDDEIITRRTSVGTYSTKGVITLQDLMNQFGKQYNEQVYGRAHWQRLRQAYDETQASFREATRLHKERSKINARNSGWFGIDIVRNIIEVFGEGDEDYPAMSQWDEPKRLLTWSSRAGRAQFEVAVPLLAMAELSTAQAAQTIFAYDHRVESGARFGREMAEPGQDGRLDRRQHRRRPARHHRVRAGRRRLHIRPGGRAERVGDGARAAHRPGLKAWSSRPGWARSWACSAARCRPGSRRPWLPRLAEMTGQCRWRAARDGGQLRPPR